MLELFHALTIGYRKYSAINSSEETMCCILDIRISHCQKIVKSLISFAFHCIRADCIVIRFSFWPVNCILPSSTNKFNNHLLQHSRIHSRVEDLMVSVVCSEISVWYYYHCVRNMSPNTIMLCNTTTSYCDSLYI